MATTFRKSTPDEPSCGLLYGGDRMSQAEFHRAYELMPPSYRAELVAGIVHEPSPVSYSHAESHNQLNLLFGFYVCHTPGTSVADNSTVMLSDEDEVQPDTILRLDEKHGGQSRIVRIDKKDWLKGAPELVAEVAHASRDIDLHLKKERYRLAGVIEYIVVCLEPSRIYWFDLRANHELNAGADGIFRSRLFPGLWIHGNALLEFDRQTGLQALKSGLQSKEHAAFAAKILR